MWLIKQKNLKSHKGVIMLKKNENPVQSYNQDTIQLESLSVSSKVWVGSESAECYKVMNTIINQQSSLNKVTNSELNEIKQQKKQ